MPFFKTPSYMEKAKTMENKPYGWVPEKTPKDDSTASSSSQQTSTSTPASSKPSGPSSSSDTLVNPTPTTTTTNDDTSSVGQKEPLSTVERIKLEREYEKAHPQQPLMPAEGIWKSKLMVIPTAVLYGFGGG